MLWVGLAAVLSSGAAERPEVATPAVSLSRLEEVFRGGSVTRLCCEGRDWASLM